MMERTGLVRTADPAGFRQRRLADCVSVRGDVCRFKVEASSDVRPVIGRDCQRVRTN